LPNGVAATDATAGADDGRALHRTRTFQMNRDDAPARPGSDNRGKIDAVFLGDSCQRRGEDAAAASKNVSRFAGHRRQLR
jgi:hypothetical protein